VAESGKAGGSLFFFLILLSSFLYIVIFLVAAKKAGVNETYDDGVVPLINLCFTGVGITGIALISHPRMVLAPAPGIGFFLQGSMRESLDRLTLGKLLFSLGYRPEISPRSPKTRWQFAIPSHPANLFLTFA
jgi:hypothetical protein